MLKRFTELLLFKQFVGLLSNQLLIKIDCFDVPPGDFVDPIRKYRKRDFESIRFFGSDRNFSIWEIDGIDSYASSPGLLFERDNVERSLFIEDGSNNTRVY